MTAVPVVLVLFEVVSGDSCRSLVVVGGRRARAGAGVGAAAPQPFWVQGVQPVSPPPEHALSIECGPARLPRPRKSQH